MMETVAFLLNAFGVHRDGGNPAGVVLNADDLTDAEKRLIAREIGFSETAFVQSSDKADRKLTFFTPAEEVDICGHATVATYSLLLQQGLIEQGSYTHELRAGVLPVEVASDGTVLMDLAPPIFAEEVPLADIENIFHVPEDVVTDTGLRPQIVSTGLRDVVLPIRDRDSLFNLQPDFQKMAELNEQTGTIGFHAFSLDPVQAHACAHARDFFPLYGVEEEPATGSANGALACYLFRHGRIDPANTEHLVFEQGYCMNKPSEVVASLKVEGGEIRRVHIGGKAVFAGQRVIRV
jgi:PhzF family phenazine biosynthesis protein